MPANDVTVTGTFKVNKYKLTYVVDGTTYKTDEIEYGQTITAEPSLETIVKDIYSAVCSA